MRIDPPSAAGAANLGVLAVVARADPVVVIFALGAMSQPVRCNRGATIAG